MSARVRNATTRQLGVLATAFVLVWSSGYVAAAFAIRTIDPLTVTFWRFLVAAAVLAVVAMVRRETWPPRRDLGRLAGIGGLMFGIQFGSLYYGMSRGVPAGTTALIACTSPLVVAVVSAGFGWDRLRPSQWLGVGLGVAGVTVTLADRVGRPPHLLDLGWTFLGLVGLSGGTVLQARLRLDAGRGAVASIEILAGAIAVGVVAPFVGSIQIPVRVESLASFGWVALVAGALAPLMLFTLLARKGALWTSSLLFVVPGVTALASWPLLSLPVGPAAGIGLGIAGAGLLLTLGASTGVRLTTPAQGLDARAEPGDLEPVGKNAEQRLLDETRT